MILFDSGRHEKLNHQDWSKEKAIQTIDDIFDKTLAAFDPKTLWPTHPDEDCKNPINKSLYFGAAGTLLGLKKISEFRNKALPFDSGELVDFIHSSYKESPDTDEVVPSFFVGQTGVLLTHCSITKSEAVASEMFEVVQSNIENPVNEALWGCPGTMIAALFMHKWTQAEKWKTLFLKNVDYLFDQWHQNEQGQWVWTQDLYGRKGQMIGAGHGFVGNLYPMLEGLELLSKDKQETLLERTSATLTDSAVTEGDLSNWPVIFDKDNQRFLVQWCHGAPGVITSLTSFPINQFEQVESLLKTGGELIWQAGPLKKTVSTCHGTDGNGYAFLKLFKRTGHNKWLGRAQKFAMHAIGQRGGRYTLWTGDLGLACYLVACLEESPKILGLDEF